MASQLQKGRTFIPGDTVNADDLNQLVDNAEALGGLIDEQDPESPLLATSVVLVRTATGLLKKRAVSTLPSGVTSVAWKTGWPKPTSVFTGSVDFNSTTPEIKLSMSNKDNNKVLAAPDNGDSGEPAFRRLVPADVNKLITIPAYIIDLDQGNTFWKVFSGEAATIKLRNGTPGQVIKVILQQGPVSGSATVAWDAYESDGVVRWPHGTDPVMSTGASATDIYEFTYLSVGGGVDNYYGTFYQQFSE